MPLVLNTASNSIIQVVTNLPVAGVQYSGQSLILQSPGIPNRLFLCTQNSAGVWQWVNVATTS